jgi:hypothetical protein
MESIASKGNKSKGSFWKIIIIMTFVIVVIIIIFLGIIFLRVKHAVNIANEKFAHEKCLTADIDWTKNPVVANTATYTSKEGFFTVRYPTFMPFTEYSERKNLSSDNFGEVNKVLFNEVGPNPDQEFLSLEYYVGFKDPQVMIHYDVTKLSEAKHMLLGGKIPAIRAVYTNEQGHSQVITFTTKSFNGVSFYMSDNEPNGKTNNVCVFDDLINSFQINSNTLLNKK